MGTQVSSKCPDWFPRPTHIDPPKNAEHWARLIVFRLNILRAPQDDEWKKDKYLSAVLSDNGSSWVFNEEGLADSSVLGLSAYEAFKIAQMYDLPGNAAAKIASAIHFSEPGYEEAYNTRHFVPEGAPTVSSEWAEEFGYRLPVLIDLAADDKKIVRDFEGWLAATKDAARSLGLNKWLFKALGSDWMQEWHDKRLLGAFDLIHWREISGARYSDAAIASWLWPDSGPLSDNTYVDRSERLRKVTKPLLDRVFSAYTVRRLEYTARAEREACDNAREQEGPAPE